MGVSALPEAEEALVTVEEEEVHAVAQEVALVVAVVQEEGASSLVEDQVDFRVADLALEAVDVVVEATKRIQRLYTPKSAKHEGVNRQRRHGVMRPWTAWEMVHKEALFRKEAVHLMFYAVQDYFEIQRRGAKETIPTSFV